MSCRVIIVGAGPAGSVASIVLARGGLDVTLIEQSRFPRSKVCGECMSARGVAVLERVGALEGLLRMGATRLTRSLTRVEGAQLELRLGSAMLGISRTAMDAHLLELAARAGARVLQPTRVTAVFTDPTPRVQTRDLLTNTPDTLEADWVICADGRSSVLGDRPEPTGDLGVKTHFERLSIDPETIELLGTPGLYFGLAPVESGRVNLAMNVPVSRVRRFGGDLEGMWASLLRSTPWLRDRVGAAVRVGPWQACPLPRFLPRRDWPCRVIPVGNAAAALEPVAGEGMGLAMWSAQLVARRLVEDPRVDPRRLSLELGRTYRRLWTLRSRLCRLAARGIMLESSPDLLRLLGSAPRLVEWTAGLMGKSGTRVNAAAVNEAARGFV